MPILHYLRNTVSISVKQNENLKTLVKQFAYQIFLDLLIEFSSAINLIFIERAIMFLNKCHKRARVKTSWRKPVSLAVSVLCFTEGMGSVSSSGMSEWGLTERAFTVPVLYFTSDKYTLVPKKPREMSTVDIWITLADEETGSQNYLLGLGSCDWLVRSLHQDQIARPPKVLHS